MRHLCAVVTCAVPSHAQATPAESDPVWDWRRRADDADVFKEVSVNELAEQLLTVCRSPRGRSTAPPWTALLWTVCSRIAPPCVSAALRPPAALRPCTDEPGAAVGSIGTALAQRPSCSVVCRSFTQKLMMYSELKHYKYKDVIMQQGEEGSKRLLIIGTGKVKIERQVRWIRAGRCGAAVAGGAGGAIGSSACGCRRRTERSR